MVACFFASGAAGLLYEVVWTKQLAYLLGNSLHAAATVVAAFLGGLALGARFLGTPLAHRRRGARIYAALELAVGVLGVLMLPLLRALDPLIGELYRGLGGETVAFAIARVVLMFVVLVPPAALMGATLPVLVAHFEWERVGAGLAWLYALNTFGAVAGSLAGGFVLLPGIGLSGTTVAAALLNAMAAALAWTTGVREAKAHARGAYAPALPPPAPEGVAGTPARAALAAMFALSGFAALLFQIAWVRLFSLVFGSSVYSFSAVLGVYLLGLAIGSAAVGRWMRRGVSVSGFGRLQLLIAAVAAAEILLFPRLPEWMMALSARAGAHWNALLLGEVGLAATVLLIPCALLGAVFPVATRLLQRGDGGHATGFAYGVNTLGTIAGSLVAGFWAVPAWGVQGTHVVAALLSGTLGLLALALARAQRGAARADVAFALGAAAAVVGCVLLGPRWDPALMSTGLFRPRQAAEVDRVAQAIGGPGPMVWRATRTERVLFYREGVNGSVLVGSDPAGMNRWLRVSGKVDASTSDMETQVLAGLVPMLCADAGARALVIGLGSGTTASAVLAGGAGRTDIVELEPHVVEASKWFHEPGENPIEDPRARLILGDARTHLMHGGARYAVIVSEPSNPWIAGVNNLFTVDFYRRVRQHLTADGVFCQWMPLYELSPRTFASLVASFLQVFPEAQVFCVWRNVDVLLVAVPPGRRMALERLATPAGRRALARARIADGANIAAYYAGPLSRLAAFARGADLNRDDRPVVEYRAPRDLIEVGRTSLYGDPQVLGQVPFAGAMPQGPLFAAWTPAQWYAARARTLAAEGEAERAGQAVAAARQAGLGALADQLGGEIERAGRQRAALDVIDQARDLLAAGRADEGREALERAVALDPDNGRAWLMLADRRHLAGDTTGVAEALAHGRASDDSEVRGEALALSGVLALDTGNAAEAVRLLRAAEQMNPAASRNYLLEARAHLVAKDPVAARQALQRGLARVPADGDLSTALASLDSGH